MSWRFRQYRCRGERFANPTWKPGMNALTKLLEDVRALRLRNGFTTRDALEIALGNQWGANAVTDTIDDIRDGLPTQNHLPAASCLAALLPRDREPTIEEIREAWQECVAQCSQYGAAEPYECVTVLSAELVPRTW